MENATGMIDRLDLRCLGRVVHHVWLIRTDPMGDLKCSVD